MCQIQQEPGTAELCHHVPSRPCSSVGSSVLLSAALGHQDRSPPVPAALGLRSVLAGTPQELQHRAGQRGRSGAVGTQRQEHISERVNRAARAPAPRCLPRSLHFYADWKPALCVLLKLNVRLLILLLVSNEI